MRALVVGGAVVASWLLLTGCAKTPSVPQQADVASYTIALESCVATAKVHDAGMAGYEACRDQVDNQYGRAPEDAGADR